jgi:hypothetical protein
MNYTKNILFAFSLAVLATHAMAQVYSDKVVGKKKEELRDSLKSTRYPYILPIWGKKVTQLGFDLPYPVGVNINYLYQESDLVINNLYVGFNGGPQYSMDEIVRFTNTSSNTSGINCRPDIWLFPFLNIYGIFAKSNSSTNVNFGIWVPDVTDTDIWTQIYGTGTKANFEGITTGFGLTPTIGVGGGFMALDMNFAWTDIASLQKPAFSFVFGPRFGKSFRLKKQQTIALWVGGFRVKIDTGTKGSMAIGDLFDTQDFEARINNGIVKVDQAQTQVDAWWNDLSTLEKNNPVNKAKYQTANRALESAGNFLNAAAAAAENIDQSTVQYSLDKQQKDLWNFVVGGQYQFNKHLMLRAEVGFLSSRTQVISGLQYRFGL